MRTYYVYLLSAYVDGVYKIGQSFEPERRFKQIKEATALLHIMPCGRFDARKFEIFLHRRFKARRYDGFIGQREWFVLDENDLRWIIEESFDAFVDYTIRHTYYPKVQLTPIMPRMPSKRFMDYLANLARHD